MKEDFFHATSLDGSLAEDSTKKFIEKVSNFSIQPLWSSLSKLKGTHFFRLGGKNTTSEIQNNVFSSDRIVKTFEILS